MSLAQPERVYHGVVVHLGDLARDTMVIRGVTFRGCRILGPAIVAPLDNCAFDSCGFEGDADSLLWEVIPPRLAVGCIGIEACRFERCHFERIGIAGAPDLIRVFRAGLPSAPAAGGGSRH